LSRCQGLKWSFQNYSLPITINVALFVPVATGPGADFGKPIDKGALYKLLNNRVYIGDAVHKGTAYQAMAD
jgi:hypothetical protein